MLMVGDYAKKIRIIDFEYVRFALRNGDKYDVKKMQK